MPSLRLSRRRFLTGCAAALAAGAAGCGRKPPSPPPAAGLPALREALFYEPRNGGSVRCRLCPRGCVIADGRRGFCRVRENRKGRLETLAYGKVAALNADPVEKKPFFHVRPGSRALSLSTAGCNFTCRFCQNYDISQASPGEAPERDLSPAAAAEQARAAGCGLLAFTYGEPVVFYEYMADCARAAKEAGLGSVMVTNGSMEPAAWAALAPLLTAVKVDLKGFSDSFYRDTCGGRLEPVLASLKQLKALGVWTEVVTLLIPGLNDSEAEVRKLSAWVAGELGPFTPLHFSRFSPQYRMRNLPPTPYETLTRARDWAAKEGCRFVYLGNAPGLGAENTACPHCGRLLVERFGYRVLANHLRKGACPGCGAAIPGVW